MKAFLILEDGMVFTGTHIGADKEIISEIVFNTSMAGYLEVLTDPSYAGQAVCMTYLLIGNYGICKDDMESLKPWPDGLIVRELSRIPSNFRCDMTIQQFLEGNGVPGIAGIDTRALTRILREKGTMNGMITTDENYDLNTILPRLKAYTTGKVVEKVTCAEKYTIKGTVDLAQNGPLSGLARFDKEAYAQGVREPKPALVRELNGAGLRIALLDLGAKANIARSLAERGCDVTVYPALTSAEEIIADAPDGIMLSNGPGDPKECVSVIAEIKKLYDTDIPIFAICLGHQLMALATGADTYKMKYGHRGGNHPVKDLATGRVYISSQNHGYVVDMDKLDAAVATPAFVNVNDGTNEGLSYTGKNIFTVQFHPEACPGPQDSGYLFDRFIQMIRSVAENHPEKRSEAEHSLGKEEK
ncbi:MAG: carbamoyl phosphate synthase small subunit [Acetatifactor sp.]|nr:carbamoyl phosphate synthase small subunit [Acetatifactor sp.]